MWCSIPSKSWHASAALIPLPSSTPPSGRSSSLSGSRRCFARISPRGKSARKTISPFLPSNAFTPSLALRRWRGSLFVRPVPVHHWDAWRGIHPAARRRIVRNAHDSYHQHLLHFGSGIGLAVSRAFAPGLPPGEKKPRPPQRARLSATSRPSLWQGCGDTLKKIHIDCDVAFGDPNLRSAI